MCRAAEQAADQSAGEGQISQQLIERMEGTLREELEADRVAVTDIYGDGRHVSIDVVSKLFDGQTSVKRQRMVYKVSFLSQLPVASFAAAHASAWLLPLKEYL